MTSARSLIPFFVVLAGVALLFWSFVSGIADALSGNSSGNVIWQVIFVLAALIVVATMVLSVINIVKKRSIVIAVATLFVGAIPLVMILVLAVMAATPGN